MGPFKVIIQEDQNQIWASRGNLFQASPEQVRPLSAYEEIQYRDDIKRGPEEHEIQKVPRKNHKPTGGLVVVTREYHQTY